MKGKRRTELLELKAWPRRMENVFILKEQNSRQLSKPRSPGSKS